ncbi:MAG: EamA family transporter [Salinibacterium sp.]|nr:EamA family transporter [Salinibacterium sp.]
MTDVPTSPRGGTLGAAGLVLVGLICQDIGAASAVTLFPHVGALGMVTLRLVFSAAILFIAFRPRLRGRSRADWLTVIAFGFALALMNGLFYEAIARLPLGITVTIEVLGPLILSVVVSRKASAWLWAVLAFIGVAIFGWGGWDHLDPIGVAFAVAAGTMWVAYILLSARTGRRFERLDGLAIAMSIGALGAIPFGIISAGPPLFHIDILLLGVVVAVLSSAIPYGLELLALRRLPAATFSILMSLSPAIAATAGLIILHQALTVPDAVAIALVVVASIGAVRSADRRQPEIVVTP